MKIAIAGKGGAGKTTLASLLAYAFAERGLGVLAIDADPSPCLGDALGFPRGLVSGLRPIAEMKDLIRERTGAEPGTSGAYFRLNPPVEDIPERFSAVHRGIRLLQIGALDQGGRGCICPESTLLRALVGHVLVRWKDVVLMDMYAGVEHLGRATADSVDAMLVVVEPTLRTLGVAEHIRRLAADIGLRHLYLVANKLEDPGDRRFIESRLPDLRIRAVLPFDPAAHEAERLRVPVFDQSPQLADAAREMAAHLAHQFGAELARP